jgi:ribokinase
MPEPRPDAREVVILGVFVADTSYRAARQPRMGETILGLGFALGPGGKGSNQAVAAARAGGRVRFVSRIGRDAFGELALRSWQEAGVIADVTRSESGYTGAAYIFIEDGTGDNAIIVAPGAGGEIAPADLDARAEAIRAAAVFVTQLEQPRDAARRGLEIARAAGVATVLNPAPAAPLPAEMLALCDWVTPNESEAEALTGISVLDPEGAEAAARRLVAMGPRGAVVTLGAQGALLLDRDGRATHVPAFRAGPVVETTGAGDAFNGAFAVALAEGRPALDAVRFGCAAAGISVTRPGTAPSMPARAAIEALLAQG